MKTNPIFSTTVLLCTLCAGTLIATNASAQYPKRLVRNPRFIAAPISAIPAPLTLIDENPSMVRTALADWMTILRSKLPEGMHTRVVGLENDPDCRGDLLTDRIFDRYFESLFDGTPPTDGTSIKLLTEIARHSACLSTQQSSKLATKIYQTFGELRIQLSKAGKSEIVPWVAQAAFAPLVLLYDVEKYRGPNFPLSKWFSDNMEHLLKGAEEKKIPACWQGLWLYDRRSGRLVGYRDSSSEEEVNGVNLGVFIRSIVSAENLGEGDCAFNEMINRGAGSHGYVCGAIKCQKEYLRSIPAFTESFSDFSSIMRQSLANPICSESVPESEEKSESEGGSGASLSPARGSPCDLKGSVDSSTSGGSFVQCASSALVGSGGGRGLVNCIAESPTRCGNPIQALTKDIGESTFKGIKSGRNCQLSRAAGSLTPQQQKDYDKARDQVDRQYQEAVKEADDSMRKANDDLISVRQQAQDTKNNGGDTTAADELVKAAEKVNSDAIAKTAADKAAAEKARQDALDKLEEEKKNREQENEEEGDTDSADEEERCGPDAENCGNDNCSAMSNAMAATMSCIHQQLTGNKGSNDPEGFPDRSPLQPDPVDPMEPVGSVDLGGCFDSIDSPTKIVSKAKTCWAYNCGRSDASSGGNGCCGGDSAELEDKLAGQLGGKLGSSPCNDPFALCSGDETGGEIPTVLPVIGPKNLPTIGPDPLAGREPFQNPGFENPRF